MRPRFHQALTASASLSTLFLAVYGACNWITSQRHDVGTFYFQWERAIPFMPFLILPYMSIDLFFIGAPFLCRTDRELRILSRRVSVATVVAGICFLLFPLRFAFARPDAGGWAGALFNWFRGLDPPYNLLPSLHAAFWLFLVQIYLRHSSGFVRAALAVWLVLIGLSPVLTYQHHVIDVIGGFALAGYCFYLFPEERQISRVIMNRRIGIYYASGAALLLAAGIIMRPVGPLLLWPASSLAIVAAAYLGVGPGIFRKTNGRLPWSTRFVLGPCLFGQYLSLLYYRRQCRPWDKISSTVWIGRKLNNSEASEAVHSGVTAVLDLSPEFSAAVPFRTITYRSIPVLDLTAPTFGQLKEMGSFISEHSRNGIVYVNCKIGYSRSAAAVGAYLIMSGRASNIDEAVAIIRGARPSIVIRSEIISALQNLTGRGDFSANRTDSSRGEQIVHRGLPPSQGYGAPGETAAP